MIYIFKSSLLFMKIALNLGKYKLDKVSIIRKLDVSFQN